ncbi:MAG: glycosyltransferase [bacterium]
MRGKGLLFFLLLGLDLLILNLSYTAVLFLRYHKWMDEYFLHRISTPYFTLLLVTNGLYLIAAHILRTYRLPQRFRMSDVIPAQGRALGFVAIGSIFIIFLTKGLAPSEWNFHFSRPTLFFFWLAGLVSTTAGRLFFGSLQGWLFRRGKLVRRLLIVGTVDGAREIAERLRLNPWFGVRLEGIAVARAGSAPASSLPSDVDASEAPVTEFDETSEIERILEERRIDEVFVALRPEEVGQLLELLESCRKRHVKLRMLPAHFQMTASHFMVSEIAFLEGANRYDILFELYGSVDRTARLDRARIAVVGSKGIPATFGGIERHVAELTSCLVTRGFSVRVYCRPYYSNVSGEYHGVELVTLPTLYTKHLDAITHTFLSTIHALFSGVDIIHYHAMGPSTLSFLPRLLGVKSVVTVHGLDWKREKWGRSASAFLRFGEYASAKFPDKTIVVSRELERHYLERHARSVAYIPNGLTLRQPLPPRQISRRFGLQGRDYVLFVGRLVPEKGCHYLIDAFRGLRTEMRLVIAGGSSHSDEYVARLHEAGAHDPRILFTGYVHGDVLTELYSNAYIYTLPSDIEGLSLSLLEALSLRGAVLASDIPENEEILIDSSLPPRGLTFHRGSSADLRDKLAFLIDNPEEAERLRDLGRAFVAAQYNWNRIADDTAAVYLSLLGLSRESQSRTAS